MITMAKHYRGTTRQEAEQAGIALPKKEYRCIYCSAEKSHDEIHHHQTSTCEKRPGSTVRAPV